MSLEDYSEWLRRRGRSQGTITAYCSLLKTSDNYADPIDFILDKSYAPKTRRTAAAALKSWATFHGDAGLLEDLAEVKKPRDSRLAERPPLSREEWQLLLDEVETSDRLDEIERATLGLLLVRGFRVGDVCRLTRRDVRDGVRTGVLRFTAKGEEKYRWPAKRFAKQLEMLDKAFQDYDAASVAELIAPRAQHPQQAAIRKLALLLKDVAADAGLDPDEIYTHRCRRTHAMFYLQAAGGDITKLKRYMGWRSLETAGTYVDYYTDEELEGIADEI